MYSRLLLLNVCVEMAEEILGRPILCTKSCCFKYETVLQECIDMIEARIKSLDKNIISFDLSDNKLGELPFDHTKRIINAIKITPQKLNLCKNNLGYLGGFHLKIFFEIVARKGIEELDLSFNGLFKLTGIELAIALNKFNNLRRLDLTGNQLWRLPAKEFTSFFMLFNQPNLDFLGFAFNNLGEKCDAEKLKHIFSLVPYGVTTVDFSGNSFDAKSRLMSLKEIIAAIHALPITVNYIDLCHNDFSSEETMELIDNLPENIKLIGMKRFKKLPVDEYIVSDILDQVKALIRRSDDGRFDINAIATIKDINKTITLLEKNDTPLANLAIAELLERTIRNDGWKANINDLKNEKILHDIITFYNKAVLDPQLKKTIKLSLWDIKTTCKLSSVRDRFLQYDLFDPDMAECKDVNLKNIKALLSNEFKLFGSSAMRPCREIIVYDPMQITMGSR